MRWKQGAVGFILKGIVISLSFVLVFGITFWLNQEYLRQASATVAVVAAKVDLLPGETLTAEMLTMVETPVLGLGEDYVTDIGALIARGPWFVGEIGVGAGDVLRPGRLKGAAEHGGDWFWEFEHRDNVRLVAVETNLVRSGGDWLMPGMRVDALVYIPAIDSYDDPQPSQVIGPEDDPNLRGLLVIDKKNAAGAKLDGQIKEDGYSRDYLPTVVVFMMEEADLGRARALIQYNEEGKIFLSPVK